MRIPELEGLERRDGGSSTTSDGALFVVLTRREEKKKSFVYIAIIVLAILTILIALFLVTNRLQKRRLRAATRTRTQQTRADDKLPSLFSWKSLLHIWRRPKRTKYSNTLQDNELSRSESREMSNSGADPERPSPTLGNGNGHNNNNNAHSNRDSTISAIDRNTSIRSVMTLPAYAPQPRDSEATLAREGERAGIDTVIEYPEAPSDEESRREEEMESLYQIRLARRREAAEREERRQARREARARGDMAALAEIRRRAEEAAESSVSQMLIAEHQRRNGERERERRVSSVQYGELGVQRHDGTRLRANSSESDQRPLLDSAASFDGGSTRSRGFSGAASTLSTHYRGPSVSSIVSSRASSEFDFPPAVHTHSRSSSATRLYHNPNNGSGSPDDDFEVVSLAHPHSRSTSRVATPSLAGSPSIEIPREEAPAYEDPPNYESPVETRAPQLPRLDPLPSIQVTAEVTPVDGRRSGSFDLGTRGR